MAKFTVLPKEKYDEIYNRASEDCISRQAAIDAINTCRMLYSGTWGKGLAMAAGKLRELPPAEHEIAKRIVGKSRHGITLWYQCDMCNEPVDAQDNFCRGCGRRLSDG